MDLIWLLRAMKLPAGTLWFTPREGIRGLSAGPVPLIGGSGQIPGSLWSPQPPTLPKQEHTSGLGVS